MTALRSLRAVLLGLLLGVLLTQFGLSLMRVEGRSMDPALFEGEVLVVARPALLAAVAALGGSPSKLTERGAVVVLPEPRSEGRFLGLARPLIVKRIVGLPGESVAFRGGQLLLNGAPEPEPWLAERYRGAVDMRPRTVPEGALFLMGDNRLPLASSDSRSFGPQPVGALRGLAVAQLRLPWGGGGLRSPFVPVP